MPHIDLSRALVSRWPDALLGATGVRLVVTLARELQRSGLRYGIAAACIGGGQGIAMLIERS